MNSDDIIYLICLLTCVGAGHFVRKIPDKSLKKYVCTGFGLLMVSILSGWNTLHCLVSTAMGAAAVIYVHPSKCHFAAFVVMFGYLTFFRLNSVFGLPVPPIHTVMIQMMLTLKIAGIGFEKTAAWNKHKERDSKQGEEIEILKYDSEIQSINIIEIFHYAFNYIGVLTGPYYRYRTYRDYFETSLANYAPNIEVTLKKLKCVCIYSCLYLSVIYIWPLNYALSDEFYIKRSFFYRIMYIWPIFFVFRMRMYAGLVLSECVCTMAGFGAYPDEVDVANGEGPRKPYMHLKPESYKGTYNFTTIVNARVMDVEKCPTFRQAMKHWNICVQYWLAVNVYKSFPSKKFRTVATLICSAYWHGFQPGHYFCIMGAPFYMTNEDLWNKLIRKDATGKKRLILNVIFWIFKFFAYSYLGIAFQLVSFDKIWKYYNSVYHIGYIAWFAFMIVGIVLNTQTNQDEEHKKQQGESKVDGDDQRLLVKEKSQ